jgi:hypothetical protein
MGSVQFSSPLKALFLVCGGRAHPHPFKSRQCGGVSEEGCWASESCLCRSHTLVMPSFIVQEARPHIVRASFVDVDVVSGGGAAVSWAAHCWVSIYTFDSHGGLSQICIIICCVTLSPGSALPLPLSPLSRLLKKF